MKKNFVRYRQHNKKGPGFWNQEYKKAGNFSLSDEPSEDLIIFTRWLERFQGRTILNPTSSMTDLGCGNGRNSIYLSRAFGLRGTGYDSSSEAITQATKKATGLPLVFEVRSIAGPIPLADKSQLLVLDMMASHFLKEKERTALRSEIKRILKPGGFLFLKTFLRDDDQHSKRLLKDHPGEEEGTYIHPQIGVAEYVPTEKDLLAVFEEDFIIHRAIKSHRHKGNVAKRRSICLYAERR